jgi:SAM-dependent methyltransferase
VSYIMESGDETRRLLVQERTGNAREALLLSGLKPGTRALDVGCGPGGITQMIAELVGPSGQVLGLDMSDERLVEARRLNQDHAHVSFLRSDVRRMDVPDAAYDYAWCQFVLQYMPDWRQTLPELVRVLRPGGKLVISEFDGFGLLNWPFPDALHSWGQRFLDAIFQATGFDILIGRKVFTELRRLGLSNVRVHLLPQYVIDGVASETMILDWKTRFTALESLLSPALGGLETYRAMSRDYLQLLADPDALKYSVLLVTEGTRA